MHTHFILLLLAQVYLTEDTSATPIRKCRELDCPKVWTPVCDTNGMMHANPCVFFNYKCKNPGVKIAYKGVCKSISTGECPNRECTKEYKPVCDSNGRTHDNKCIFTNYQCNEAPSVTIVRDGKCKTSSPGCEVVRCAAGYTCVEKPTTQCVPIEPPIGSTTCAATLCPVGTNCVEELLPCLKPPCPVQAKCVRNCSKKCGPFQECFTFEGDDYCRDTCSPGRCSDRVVCSLEKVVCKKIPCPPVAKCEKPRKCTKECGKFQECYLFDNKEYCRDTCAEGRCPNGQQCSFIEVNCFVPPCAPIAQCIQESPCNLIDCFDGYICIDELSECPNPPCPLEGKCIPVVPTTTTDHDCSSIVCPLHYLPVCGTDGHTYGNSCGLQAAQCANPDLAFAYDGECESSKSQSDEKGE